MRCTAGCLRSFRRLSVLMVLLATPLIFVWVGMSQQQDVTTTPLEKLVPSRTIAFLSAPNLAQLKADFKKTSMNKIWNDEEVKFTVDMVMKSVQKPLDEFKANFEKETGTKFDSALELLDGQVSVALVDIGGTNKEMPFSVAVAVDVKNKKDVAEKLISTFEKSLMEGSGNDRSPFETLKVRDMDFRRFEPEDGVEIYFGFLGGTFVACTNRDAFTLMVTNYKEPTPDQLANNPLFQQLKKKVGGDKLAAFLYVTDAESIIAKFEDEIDPEAANVIENLGLKTIGGLAAGMTLGSDAPGLCAYLHAPGERKGLTKIASLFKPSPRSTDCVPADAVAYAAMRVNMSEVYDEIMKIAEGIADKGDWENFKEKLADYEKKVGCSIKADLLDSIGEDIVTYSAYPEGGSLMPYTVYVLDLKNTDKAVTSIEKMIAGTELLQVKSIPFKNAEIKYVSVKGKEDGRGRMDEEEMVMMSASLGFFGSFPMSYCVLKDKLYLSTFAQGLKDMLRGIENAKPVPGVPAPPHRIADELKGVPADAVAVSYTDMKAIFAPIYNTLLQVLCMVEPMIKANVSLPFELDMAAMPSAHAIAQYLTPTVGWCTSDKDGFTIKSGSESGLVLGVGGVAMVAAIAIPSLLKSRVAANETSAAGTLKNLVTSEATWRQNDTDRNAEQDYWTGDVSGFYRMLDGAGNAVKVMDIAVAKADWAPLPADGDGTAPDIGAAVAAEGAPTPKSGYYFIAMRTDENGEPYQTDGADADANAWENTGDFAFVAFPAVYGKTGINTFIVNGDGVIWKKDLGPILDKKAGPVPPEAPLTPEVEKRIDELIAQLAADDFDTREAAEAELGALGKSAAPKLEKAAESDDPETRMRAKKLLRNIDQGGLNIEAIQTWPGIDPSMEGWQMVW